jgi:hypothetical protein
VARNRPDRTPRPGPGGSSFALHRWRHRTDAAGWWSVDDDTLGEPPSWGTSSTVVTAIGHCGYRTANTTGRAPSDQEVIVQDRVLV